MRHGFKALALIALLAGPMAAVTTVYGISSAYAEELSVMPVVDGEVLYQEVFDVAGDYNEEDIFQAIKASLDNPTLHRKVGQSESVSASMFGVRASPQMAGVEAAHGNSETMISESPPRQLKYNLYEHFEGKGVSSAVRTLYVSSRLDIDIKQGRYRATIKDFEYEHWNHYTATQQAIYLGGTGCGVRGTLYELQNVCNSASGSRKKALVAIDEDVKELMAKLYEDVKKNLASAGSSDDW